MGALRLTPGELTLEALRLLWCEPRPIELDPGCYEKVERAAATVRSIVARGKTVYGINTGFGLLAQTRIPADQLERLQTNLVLSHSTGVGEPLGEAETRLAMVLKLASLAQGYSGCTRATLDCLNAMLDHGMYPLIPGKGSVGASGDLAPLAHLSAALLGHGRVRWNGRTLDAGEGLAAIGLQPLQLGPKEGLALLNGTQVSCALALAGLFGAERAFTAALAAGAMSVDAARGSDGPFDERIHRVRGQPGQLRVAAALRELLAGSEIRASHRECERVQDPYCLRCQPQVMGACLDTLSDAARTLLIEANAVTDNPVVFPDEGEVISGGNFHAEPVALAADALALALTEIGNLSERRIALLVDPHLSGLPAFLVEESGVNSGFMIAQVTAAALASENRQLAHPASADSIPTSANQEDHVSMATHAARRLAPMAEHTITIAAIELMAAAQGIEFQRPRRSSERLEALITELRRRVARYTADRYFAPDIEASVDFIGSDRLYRELAHLVPSGAVS